MNEQNKPPTYWDRTEALERLRACNNNSEKIDEWNAYRKANPDWNPDLSDKDDPADLKNLKLFYNNEQNQAVDINLWEANLTGATLVGANLSEADVTDVKYNRSSMHGNYQGIRAETCYGNALFRRDAMDQDFIDTLKNRRMQSKLHWRMVSHWLWWLTDFGRGLGRVSVYALIVACIFGVIYQQNPDMLKYNPDMHLWWYTPYYYSIVTYTTLGFGDVTPITKAGQLLVTLEVILGYLTLGLLVSILANKVARRS